MAPLPPGRGCLHPRLRPWCQLAHGLISHHQRPPMVPSEPRATSIHSPSPLLGQLPHEVNPTPTGACGALSKGKTLI